MGRLGNPEFPNKMRSSVSGSGCRGLNNSPPKPQSGFRVLHRMVYHRFEDIVKPVGKRHWHASALGNFKLLGRSN